MTKEKFSEFLVEISVLMDEEEFTILMDNARSHSDCPYLSDIHHIKMLPKYCPFLNLTELANSALKAAVKRNLTEPGVQRRLHDREAARNANLTLHSYRTDILKEIISQNLVTITSSKCASWFRHLTTYTRRCLNQEDIFS